MLNYKDISRRLWIFFSFIWRIFARLSKNEVAQKKSSNPHSIESEQYNLQNNEELNQLKIRFFTNISHEFRIPLTLIIAPVEKMLKLNKFQRDDMLMIRKNAYRLLQLINQLLEFRKLESGKLKLYVQKGNIVDFVNQVTSAFEILAEQKKISLKFESQESSIELWFDHDKMEKILYNLLSNAFKFTNKEGSIVVKVEKSNNNKTTETIKISISDTGIGIDKEKIQNIFLAFYQIHDTSGRSGSGLGLSFAKELVELHNGTISVTSEVNKGSCFTVEISTGKEHFSTEQFSDEPGYYLQLDELKDMISNEFSSDQYENEAVNETSESALTNVNSYLILIVEDNNALRSFLARSLHNDYRIIEAVNGEEALDLAILESPDLIISDIMMPKMNGIELCKNIKSNLQTSHIPFLLLTARNDSRIEGIKTGADDFITKPFIITELELKIKNILDNRKKLLEKYKRDLILKPKDITPTNADEKFMTDIMAIVEENISNTDFDLVESVSKMGISRSVLYRKMHKLMNQSPNEFMNIVRLKKAAQLLKQNKFKISDVAYEVGFNDPLYFSKCFKKQFNLSPSDYVKQNIAE
jgi:signal transduction histidine kinase/DNA-binding response OmpR family regulator